MPADPRDTPVALLIYNRAELTERVFEGVRAAQPRTLLVVGDGPHPARAQDAAKVAAARAIVERIDWPCKLHVNFAPANLGCRVRVATGLTWVFDTVEEAIVLEDDCLPDLTFFRFCRELLDRYRDQRVMTIDGCCHLAARLRPPHSYFFSKNIGSWGWASWRRAWRHFDMHMKTWPAFRDQGWLRSVVDTPREADYWTARFDAAHAGLKDSWAFAWRYACWSHCGLSAQAARNLVTHAGSGAAATQARSVDHPKANAPLQPLGEIVHPPFVVRDKQRDLALFRDHVCLVGDEPETAPPLATAPPDAAEYQRLLRRTRYLEDQLIALRTEAGKRDAQRIRQEQAVQAAGGVSLARRVAERLGRRLRRAIVGAPAPTATPGNARIAKPLPKRFVPLTPEEEAALRQAPRIVVGAGRTVVAGWFTTDRGDLDLTRRDDFARRWQPGSRDAFLAEHVWEHLTPAHCDLALAHIFEFLRPGGRLRIAVPDGLHPDPVYQQWVRPGGTGTGAKDHKVFWTYVSLRDRLLVAGFEVKLLEYWDEQGRFHYEPWTLADGPIHRTAWHDERNLADAYGYTSLLVDAFKPAAAALAA